MTGYAIVNFLTILSALNFSTTNPGTPIPDHVSHTGFYSLTILTTFIYKT